MQSPFVRFRLVVGSTAPPAQEFAASYANLGWGVEADSDPRAAHLQDGDGDTIADMNRFTNSPAEDEHRCSP
jgi:hypothetical protein